MRIASLRSQESNAHTPAPLSCICPGNPALLRHSASSSKGPYTLVRKAKPRLGFVNLSFPK